jgi:glyoxylase-like metal-dependent hydrolase (beta-lactamase superfamily II)
MNSQDMNDVAIKVTKLSESVYMLVGAGGNIGVSVGEDGVYLIDSQFGDLSQKITTEIQKLSDKPINFLVNTHHHGDHTGGNENFNKQGAYIIAHDNVRKNLDGKSKETRPVITFNDTLSLYLNGEETMIFHVENAHTNGDALLYFTNSNVLHTGDTYFNGRYPYIDLNDGGSVDGYIAAVKKSLILIDDNTKVIPGHGDLSNKAEYQSFLVMMEDLRTIILAEIKKGKTENDVAANSSLTKTYDDLGYSWNFITSEKIRRTFFKSLK